MQKHERPQKGKTILRKEEALPHKQTSMLLAQKQTHR